MGGVLGWYWIFYQHCPPISTSFSFTKLPVGIQMPRMQNEPSAKLLPANGGNDDTRRRVRVKVLGSA